MAVVLTSALAFSRPEGKLHTSRTYYYRARPVKAGAAGEWSGWVSAPIIGTDNCIDLSWSGLGPDETAEVWCCIVPGLRYDVPPTLAPPTEAGFGHVFDSAAGSTGDTDFGLVAPDPGYVTPPPAVAPPATSDPAGSPGSPGSPTAPAMGKGNEDCTEGLSGEIYQLLIADARNGFASPLPDSGADAVKAIVWAVARGVGDYVEGGPGGSGTGDGAGPLFPLLG